jgi:hypothetical protein
VPSLGLAHARAHALLSFEPVPMADRRTIAKLIRFHPAELSLVAERARACGLTPARFIRETALGAIPRAKRYADTAPLLHQVARIGRDLEQLARAARERGEAPEATRLAAALDAHLVAVRSLARGVRCPVEE